LKWERRPKGSDPRDFGLWRDEKMVEERRKSGKEGKGTMTVQEAGRKGGLRTAQTHGKEFYEEIGHKGGQKVKELIEEGKKAKGLTSGR
jgi:general stress protein YciG